MSNLVCKCYNSLTSFQSVLSASSEANNCTSLWSMKGGKAIWSPPYPICYTEGWRWRKYQLSTMLQLRTLTTAEAYNVASISSERRLCFGIMYHKRFIFKARRGLWESYSHFQYQGGKICGDMLISKVRKGCIFICWVYRNKVAKQQFL